MTFQHELDRAGPIVDRLNAAIRDNPLAAGLIGAGVAWMLMGGAKGFGVMFGAVTSAAGAASSAAATASSAVASGVTKAGSATGCGTRNCGARRRWFGGVLVPDISAPDTVKAVEAVAAASSAFGARINSAAAAGREYGATINPGFPKAWRASRCCLALSASPSAQVLHRLSPPRPLRVN